MGQVGQVGQVGRVGQVEQAGRKQSMTSGPWLLNLEDRADVERYLAGRGLVSAGDLPIAIARAGAGNMNLAVRITLASGQTFVVKQGRPWVEKYPQIPAPFERTLVEAAFYAELARDPRASSLMPAVLDVDADNHILVLEDVGSAGDFTFLYSDGSMPAAALAQLIEWLGWLGEMTPRAGSRDIFANRAMRALNHEHMFNYPLRDGNGLDLDGITPGLGAAAREMAADRPYVDGVTALGRRYLADGDTLVHGDYFPGSWLRSEDGVRIIDPEFCFLGGAEFDYGILIAHLMLASCDAAAIACVKAAIDARRLDAELAARYAGVEIMRRLIGVAQLPIVFGIDRKRTLLNLSRRLVVEPDKGFA
jgi:5-methylthioribose kinase